MKLLVDTNIWLRYLVANDPVIFADCKALIENIQSGKVRPYVSTIILLELNYVLRSVYQIPQSEINKDISAILESRGLVIIEKTDFTTAFALHQKTGVNLSDCLIAGQIRGDLNLCTYDREFRKIPGILPLTPKTVIEKIN